jgi:hypothetical protein
VKAPQERDDTPPLRVIPRQLQRRFNGLGPGVREERSLRARERGNRIHLLAKLHLRLVVEVGSRHVQEPLCLVDDCRHDCRVRVTRGVDRDARGAVEEHVAVNILNGSATTTRHHEGIAAGVRGRDDLAVAFDDGPGLGAGKRGFDDGRSHTVIVLRAASHPSVQPDWAGFAGGSG